MNASDKIATVEKKRPPAWAIRTFKVLAFLMALQAGVLYLRTLNLMLNLTPSMPEGVYRIFPIDRALVRGDIVAICPPPRLAAQVAGRERDMRWRGSGMCVGHTYPLIKYIAAIGGDVVDLRTDGISVNGVPLPPSPTLVRDRSGAPVPHIPRGRYVLAAGEVWLWTPYSHSWDSRYYGPMESAGVRGFAQKAFVYGPWADWSGAQRVLARIPGKGR